MNDFDTFFVSPEVHERTVELADGTKHILHFREVPATVFRKFQMDESSDDEDVRANSIARLIAASLCKADGSPAISVEKAATLKPNPSNAIFSAVLSVNGVGAKGKAQPPGGTDWFWHVLALALGGRTVEEWQACMTQAEFQRWGAFFRENPFDDFHRYHRPAGLISVSLGGGDVQDKLDWLRPPPDTGHTGADMDLFKAAGITPPRKEI